MTQYELELLETLNVTADRLLAADELIKILSTFVLPGGEISQKISAYYKLGEE